MNWGKGIAIVYIVFVLLIAGLVYLATQQKFDLVSDDYYEQELKYQDKLDANNNVVALNDKINFSLQGEKLIIELPSDLHTSNISGKLNCYYKADSKNDLSFDFEPDENGKQVWERNKFVQGFYILKLSFNDGIKNYYVEKEMKF